MKKIISLIIILIPLIVLAQEKQTFESPNLKSIIAKHKIVAILPYTVSITYRKQPKGFSAEANKAQEQSMSTSIQGSMYTYLLRRGKDYLVSFQDVDKTNVLLKRAGMEGKLNEFTMDEVAKTLGVDAVIGGRFETEQTKSDGAAIATMILLGGLGGKTGSGSLTLTLSNGADGDLLWRFFKTMDDTVGGSTDDLVERMMKKVSRNFPYEK
jgi:hypothetical protein